VKLEWNVTYTSTNARIGGGVRMKSAGDGNASGYVNNNAMSGTWRSMGYSVGGRYGNSWMKGWALMVRVS
jgi:hypothetical protein